MPILMNGRLVIGAASGTDNDFIYFDDTDEGLFWNETEDRFEFSNALLTLGPIQTGSGAPTQRAPLRARGHAL